MNTNKFIAKDHIVAFNSFKNSIHTFTKDNLQEIFKLCGIPSNNNFFYYFKKSGLIISVGKDIYEWKDDKPIHYQLLQNIYSDYQTKINKYVRDYLTRKRKLNIEKKKAINSAISLLEENGYAIFIPYNNTFKKVTSY